MSPGLLHANPLHTQSLRRGSDPSSPDFRSRWYSIRGWLTNAALIVFGCALVLLSRQLVMEYDHFTIGFSGVSSWSAVFYIASVLVIVTQPVNRFTFSIILTFAVACCLAPLFADPFTSSDIYRYVWDGIVQHNHISPYRYAPGDPALSFLRAPNQEVFDNINRRDYAHTIYPPVAQAIFYCITFFSPTVQAMKFAMVVFASFTLFTLIKILDYLGFRREQVLLFAWCPLLVWEVAGAGHVDAIAFAFISGALLFRIRRQALLAGLFLGLAVMTKLYPIVLLPALLIPLTPRANAGSRAYLNPRNWDWKLPATTFAVVVLGYAAYSSVGRLVFGYLGGYVQEEGLASGTRYFLLELLQHIPGFHNLSAGVFYVLCVLIFGTIKVWGLQRIFTTTGVPGHEGAFLQPAFALAAALMFLFSPHYAWYILWLIPFFTLVPNLPILTYLMAFFYLFTSPLADGTQTQMFLLNKILYGAVAIAVVIQLVLRKSRILGLKFQQAPTESQRPS